VEVVEDELDSSNRLLGSRFSELGEHGEINVKVMMKVQEASSLVTY